LKRRAIEQGTALKCRAPKCRVAPKRRAAARATP
jgi:hypothetical protein